MTEDIILTSETQKLKSEDAIPSHIMPPLELSDIHDAEVAVNSNYMHVETLQMMRQSVMNFKNIGTSKKQLRIS